MLRNWHVGLSERIDISRSASVQLQIVQETIRDIENGQLRSGSYLPSSRDLARTLGVNRKAVVFAYEDLIAQGWLATAGTRGTMVSTSLPKAKLPGRTGADVGYSFSTAPERPLAIPEGPGQKLDEGAPDGRLFPPELLARAYRTAAHRIARANGFQYRDPRGVPILRVAIAEMLKAERGLQVTAENICITRGSQNGIFLASQILLEPGDAVLVEELTYEPAVAALRALGAEIVAVGVDEGGANMADVAAACRAHRVRAMFVTPHHQFPTTVSMRPERRLQLVELARQFGFAIIEDDYDHEFHFESQPLLPIAAYAPGETIYVGSMSKLLLPSLRVGYIAAPVAVIDAIAHRVSLTDGMGNSLVEEATADLITSGEVRRHVRKARQIYSRRRAGFAHHLDTLFGDRVEYRIPDGGLAFWLRFRTDLDRLEQRARESGLRFASSRSFMVRDTAARGLRVGFASMDEEACERALLALRRAAE